MNHVTVGQTMAMMTITLTSSISYSNVSTVKLLLQWVYIKIFVLWNCVESEVIVWVLLNSMPINVSITPKFKSIYVDMLFETTI